MLIDIHTHISSPKSSQLRFLVGKHSLGIHPWELKKELSKESIEQQWLALKAKFSKEILAIGECGLDRARSDLASMDVQLEVLHQHLRWAQKVNLPVIIHCVRAYSDLLMLLKKIRFQGKILLHDYAGNLDEASKLLAYDAYFSFGARVMDPKSKASVVLKNLPIERVFFETDDQTQWSLEQIYDKACELLKMDQGQLEEKMHDNLLTFFSDLKDVSPSDLIHNLS